MMRALILASMSALVLSGLPRRPCRRRRPPPGQPSERASSAIPTGSARPSSKFPAAIMTTPAAATDARGSAACGINRRRLRRPRRRRAPHGAHRAVGRGYGQRVAQPNVTSPSGHRRPEPGREAVRETRPAIHSAADPGRGRQSRALCRRGGGAGPGGRRRAGLHLRHRRRHRQLRQRPAPAQRGPAAAAGGGADRGDAQLFPLRLSAARRPQPAVQHHHRHDDDAVERELAAAPVGLRGYDLPRQGRPAANLVFLVDVSGSMDSVDKLPLVQCSLALLAQRLNPRDRVAIVVYAGAAGLVLEPTSDRRTVIDALQRLKGGRLDRGRGRHPARLPDRAPEHDRRRHQPRHPRHRRRLQRRRHQQRDPGRHGPSASARRASP